MTSYNAYNIRWKKSAKKELLKIDKSIIPLIITAVEDLKTNPFPNQCKKLTNNDFIYRIRVKDYRIVYSVSEDILTVEIIRVRHRKDIYR
jgi:mRNA interferase RelE/StbE